jgi:uncharacterized protein YndB with AHSA1/START domain
MTNGSDELTVHFIRVLPAPRSRVYAMCAEPEQIARWFGPKGFAAREVEVDLRVGGSYRLMMQPPTGEPFGITGEYREIDPTVRLVFTFRYDEPDPDDRDTTVSISLRELDDATELTLDQGVFATEARRALHEQGWTDSIDRMHGLITAST